MINSLKRFNQDDISTQLLNISSNLRRVSFWAAVDFKKKKKLISVFLRQTKVFLRKSQKAKNNSYLSQKQLFFFDELLSLYSQFYQNSLKTEKQIKIWAEEVLTLSALIQHTAFDKCSR